MILLFGFASTFARDLPLPLSSDAPDSPLPALLNTPEGDRLMLKETGDQYIYDPDQAMQQHDERIAPAEQATGARLPQVQARHAADTVWQLVRQSRRLEIPDNEKISDYRRQYQREAIWISKILQRATPYVGHIVESLDARYLPVELALLPAIESGYRPDTHSAEKAAGIWQIVPLTASDIGIKRNPWFDGRADIVESTVAAIDYLSYLNAEFHGDWLLTLAAYNAGLGRVRAAIERNRKRGLPADFWSLTLPRETRNYVPKFLALVAMLRHDSLPDFVVPDIGRGNGFELLDIGQRTSLDRVAAVTGISETSLQKLNAGLIHGVTPPDGPHYVYVPKDQAKQVIDRISALPPEELYSPPANYTVVKGDTIGAIARRNGLSEKQLMAMNSLDNSFIRVGQQLALRPDNLHTDGVIEYVVTIGDTLSDIARRFSVRLDDILDARGSRLEGDVIHPGETLSIRIETDPSG